MVRGIVYAACIRVGEELDSRRQRGERVIGLTEIAESTSPDPTTDETVMGRFVNVGFGIERHLKEGEIRWYLSDIDCEEERDNVPP